MIYEVKDNQTFFELAEGTKVKLGNTEIVLLNRVAVKADGVVPFEGVVDLISSSGNATPNACLVVEGVFEPKTDDEPVSVEDLVKNNSRADLEEMAKNLGLDGDAYTNKTELATAILSK